MVRRVTFEVSYGGSTVEIVALVSPVVEEEVCNPQVSGRPLNVGGNMSQPPKPKGYSPRRYCTGQGT